MVTAWLQKTLLHISHLKQLLSRTCNKLSTEPKSIFHHPKTKTKERQEIQSTNEIANHMGSIQDPKFKDSKKKPWKLDPMRGRRAFFNDDRQ
jgi:hypothetical protein